MTIFNIKNFKTAGKVIKNAGIALGAIITIIESLKKN